MGKTVQRILSKFGLKKSNDKKMLVTQLWPSRGLPGNRWRYLWLATLFARQLFLPQNTQHRHTQYIKTAIEINEYGAPGGKPTVFTCAGAVIKPLKNNGLARRSPTLDCRCRCSRWGWVLQKGRRVGGWERAPVGFTFITEITFRPPLSSKSFSKTV